MNTVYRCIISVAIAYLFMQILMLERMLQAFPHARPSFMIKHMSWDETGEKLSGGLSATTTFEIMVCRIKLIWGWSCNAAPMSLEIVIPPIMLPSPSAANMYYGMFHSSFVSKIHTTIRKMLD